MPTTSTRRYAPSPALRKRQAPLFGDYAHRWLGQQRTLADGGLLRISSLHRYETALRAHLLPFFAALPLAAVNRDRCDGFRVAAVNVGRLNPATVNSVMQILRLILRAAYRDELLTRDPMSGMRPLRVTPRNVESYNQREITRLLDAVEPRERLIVALAALAGLRQGEILALKPGDIDLTQRCVRVRRSLQRHHPGYSVIQRLGPTKTTSGYRETPLQSRLADLIMTHFATYPPTNQYDLLCAAPDGEPWLPIAFHRTVYVPAIRRAGLRAMRFHDLRRSFVAQCVTAGIPVAQAAAWLGHSVRMTEWYYQTGHAELVAALDRLDQTSET
jgi:integrase